MRKTSSLRRIADAVIIVVALFLCSGTGIATTAIVTVGTSNCFCSSPSTVTIHPSDMVQWIWDDNRHASTSGINKFAVFP